MRPTFLAAAQGGLVLLFAAGCSVDSTEFISKYAEAECEFAMLCYEPSILQFNGWSDAAECVTERGPELTGDSQDCTYDKKKAKACLKAMKDLPCPTEGDPVVPEICTQVFTCDGTGTPDTDTDTP